MAAELGQVARLKLNFLGLKTSDTMSAEREYEDREWEKVKVFPGGSAELLSLSSKALMNLQSLPDKGWGEESYWCRFDTMEDGQARTGFVVTVSQHSMADNQRMKDSLIKASTDAKTEGEGVGVTCFYRQAAEELAVDGRYLIGVVEFNRGEMYPLSDIFEFDAFGQVLSAERRYGGYTGIIRSPDLESELFAVSPSRGRSESVDPIVLEKLKDRFEVVQKKLEGVLVRLPSSCEDPYIPRVGFPAPPRL